MIKNPFAGYNPNNPFGADAMKRTRNLFGVHTTPREWKHGARDIPFGKGAATVHVGGAAGDDSNDGESWITAKETIQGAVDVADPWTEIFIKAGTYAENVVIADDTVHLVGQSRKSVVIRPGSGSPLTVSGDGVAVRGVTLYNSGVDYCASVTGDWLLMDDVGLDGVLGASGIDLEASSHTRLNELYAVNSTMSSVIYATGASEYFTISNCKFDLGYASTGFVMYLSGASKSEIINNDIGSMTYGVWLTSGCDEVSVTHNNFIGNDYAFNTLSSSCLFRENFYDDHTNIDNGHGIATEPYITNEGDIDLRPVVARNGWDTVRLLRLLLRKKTAVQTTAAATDANGLAWVDLKTITPTTSDVELYQFKMTTAGSWGGNAKYRVIIGSTKVYPFPNDKIVTSGVLESFVFPINVQINETCKIQFRSSSSGDGAGDTLTLDQLDYATVL